MVGVDAIGSDPEGGKRVTLYGEVLAVGRAAGIADHRVRHGPECNAKGPVTAKHMVLSM